MAMRGSSDESNPTTDPARQRCPVNYESSHPSYPPSLTSQSLFTFLLFFPTLPPSFPPALSTSSLQEKKPQKKKKHQSNSLTHSPAFKPSPQPSLLSRLITIIPESNSTRTLVSNISHHPFTNSPSPSSWQTTPLRSISTRSLTGYLKVRFPSYLLGT